MEQVERDVAFNINLCCNSLVVCRLPVADMLLEVVLVNDSLIFVAN